MQANSGNVTSLVYLLQISGLSWHWSCSGLSWQKQAYPNRILGKACLSLL